MYVLVWTSNKGLSFFREIDTITRQDSKTIVKQTMNICAGMIQTSRSLPEVIVLLPTSHEAGLFVLCALKMRCCYGADERGATSSCI